MHLLLINASQVGDEDFFPASEGAQTSGWIQQDRWMEKTEVGKMLLIFLYSGTYKKKKTSLNSQSNSRCWLSAASVRKFRFVILWFCCLKSAADHRGQQRTSSPGPSADTDCQWNLTPWLEWRFCTNKCSRLALQSLETWHELEVWDLWTIFIHSVKHSGCYCSITATKSCSNISTFYHTAFSRPGFQRENVQFNHLKLETDLKWLPQRLGTRLGFGKKMTCELVNVSVCYYRQYLEWYCSRKY